MRELLEWSIAFASRYATAEKRTSLVVVEPWASEICLASGEDCDIVLIGNTGLPNHSIELCSYGLIICAEDGMDGHELWLRGERVVW
ncbi:MAG: hypothetical protein ACO1RT_18050 [Planctomycetaceae bacterium]